MNEQVLVIKRKQVEKLIDFLIGDTHDFSLYPFCIRQKRMLVFIDALLMNGFFRTRTQQLENDPEFLQIIPYILICSLASQEYFTFIRLDRSKEHRLHGMISFGVGGHINPCDIPLWVHDENCLKGYDIRTMYNCVARELNEELVFDDMLPLRVDEGTNRGFTTTSSPGTYETMGVIYNPDAYEMVQKVHIGIVGRYNIKSIKPEVREIDKMCGKWMKSDDLGISYGIHNYEPWSEFLFNNITQHQKLAFKDMNVILKEMG